MVTTGKHPVRLLALSLGLLGAAALWAQPLPPSLPPSADVQAETEVLPGPGGEEGVEPEVTIIQRPGAIIEEYRLNGRLYRIRVIPRWGPPYYLVPTGEGGGWRVELDNLAPLSPPMWLLYSW